MVRNLGKPFCEILGWVVFGDVLNNLFYNLHFSKVYIIKVFRLYIRDNAI